MVTDVTEIRNVIPSLEFKTLTKKVLSFYVCSVSTIILCARRIWQQSNQASNLCTSAKLGYFKISALLALNLKTITILFLSL